MTQRQEIVIGATAEGTDGELGQLTDVIVNPLRRRATHIVIREREAGARTFVVPVSRITGTGHETVRLGCTVAELKRFPEFRVTSYVAATDPRAEVAVEAQEIDADLAVSAGTSLYYAPYVVPDGDTIPVTEERVPAGEVAFSRGTRVRASDDHEVGSIEEFVLDPQDESITHVIVRSGHLMLAREVAVPVAALATTTDGDVRLNLTRKEVERLPAMPVRRHYDWSDLPADA
jgi:sporulation protein YlmC with PRC-barrel domain